MSSDEEYNAIYENRYKQEDPEEQEAPSDEEAELAAYLAAKAEVQPAVASFKNDEEGLKQKHRDVISERKLRDKWAESLELISDTPLVIENAQDDLQRELAFLTAALSSAKRGFTKLKDLKVPFTRPTDYFAEMIKSDAHMEKVRQSLVSEKKRIEEAEERRKQRELKKFGKKVQTEKLLERAKEKRSHMDSLKKWRKDRSSGAGGLDDEFPIEMDAQKGNKKSNDGKKVDKKTPPHGKQKPKPGGKRAYKDSKYGFGGGKKHAKSNTAESVNEFSFDKTKNKELPKGLKKKFGLKGGPNKKIAKNAKKQKQNRPGKRARNAKKR